MKIENRNETISKGGFTLVEMVVTVAIFAIITTIVIARNAAFDNETLLNNLAYDIALSVRQAQQFGINIRVSAGQFDYPYGIHFTAGATTYEMFSDINQDGTYNAPGELLQTYTIGRGAHIGELCNVDVGDCGLEDLTVIFRRPDPDAVIENGAVARARVQLVSIRGDGNRYVEIQSTGQISIKKPSEIEKEVEGGGRGGLPPPGGDGGGIIEL